MSLVAIVLTVIRELASTASPSPIEGMIDTQLFTSVTRSPETWPDLFVLTAESLCQLSNHLYAIDVQPW
jgi:hypothetical protein